jgi:3-oxoadipate enol-lactonase
VTLHHDVRGEGPPVLLVHAGIADSRMWAPLSERLVAAGYRTVACDLRGFGSSPLEPGLVSNAADLVALLDHLRIDRAAVVGASFGGRVALELALRAPDRVAALALIGSGLDAFEWSDELDAFDAEEADALERGDLDAAVQANVRMWVTRGDRAVDPAVVELVATMQRAAFEAQIGVDADLEPNDPPVAERLHEIAAPVLVVVGAEDVEDFLRLAGRFAENLPAAEPPVIIDDAAHLPALERPDDVAAALVPFLRAAVPPAAAG